MTLHASEVLKILACLLVASLLIFCFCQDKFKSFRVPQL